ncbi:endonuclease/exonuclease/phosphatase family protein [Paracoccus sp. p4-l81]|uniref:endonuclease/exonuclease/phosphatase family protein n=1 Tax=Paracoccus sp. p4-l81 TaxID=3342806 RepID=UPI0035B8B017
MIRALALLALTTPAWADPLRVATYNPGLSRDGPGLLLAALEKGTDPQIEAALAVIAAADADVILLTELDWDYDARALNALTARLAAEGADYPHVFAPQPNTGLATGLDLDGNTRLAEPRDAQGYGSFTGQGGMALLSRFPIGPTRDLSGLLWRDLPGNLSQDPPDIAAIQRLSTSGHWIVPVETPAGTLDLLAYAATPPVFDGPEDRNGRRNHDETALWLRYLDGQLTEKPSENPVIVLGTPNLDPVDGDGQRAAITALLANPRLQDPRPTSPGGAAAPQTGRNAAHQGDPALDTTLWPAEAADDPGNLRADMILPDARLTVTASGVMWPTPDDPLAATIAAASDHRLVWVELTPR